MAAPERIGDYEILGELGRGGVGIVYRARKLSLPDREVALKEVPLATAAGAARERTMREVRALLRIQSLHIVTLHDVFEAPERSSLCIVMERLRPETLRDRLDAQSGPMPLDVTIATLDGVLDALEATHGARDEGGALQPIVHRDLKPENVGLQEWRGAEIVKVMDFGIARVAEGGGQLVRAAGTLYAYTPAYAAPEVLMGQIATPAADLWSAGMILWEMLAGRHPFLDASGKMQPPMQALVAHQGVLPALPAHLLPRIPEALVDLQRDLCAHEPALRPTAGEARIRLLAIAAATPTLAGAAGTAGPPSARIAVTTPKASRPPGPTVREGPGAPRRSRVALVLAIAGATLAAAALLGAGFWWARATAVTDTPPTVGLPAPVGVPAVPPPTSTVAGGCPELAAYDPALAVLPATVLEERIRAASVMMPSTIDRSLDAIRGAVSAYRPEKRDCMVRAMLIAQLTSQAALARTIPGGWAQARSSTEVAGLFRTIPLREPWTLPERNDVLDQIERNVIASLQVDGDRDREYYRRMYYGLLVQCEGTDEALRALAVPPERTACVRFRPAGR